jgi:hypothetical protein
VGRQHHLRQAQERVVFGKGFLIEDVQARAGEGALAQGREQGAFINEPAPRRIDDDRSGGKARQGFGI